MGKCKIAKNLLGRWFIAHPDDPKLAWSGSRWAGAFNGIPTGRIQISNFATEDDAYWYARDHGFDPIIIMMEE